MTSQKPRIAIVGAGFSGTLLAAHLVERCRHGVQVRLYERGNSFARGMAYSTSNPSHLLNAPAGRMSAFPDRPDDFVEWLRGLPPRFCPSLPERVSGADFVSRRLYGAYLQHILGEALWGRRGRSTLDLVTDEARDVEDTPHGLDVTTALGRRAMADVVVLAAGNLPPSPPPVADPAFYASARYRNDPWEPGALDDLDPDAPVLLIGTGLTMVDCLVSLLDQGHRGPVHALSRRGLLPRAHAPCARPASAIDPGDLPGTMVGLLRFLRAEGRAAEAEGRDWRCVLDGMRGHLPALWQGLAEGERRRFLRHLRPWWDVHRHRMAPAVARRVEAALASGRLRTHAARIERYVPPAEDGPAGLVTVECRGRGGGRVRVEAARVINCTGPALDPMGARDPLVSNLLASGMAAPGELGLGIETTPEGRVVAAHGAPHANVYAVGPLTRERFWESTAVGEIRAQVLALAEHLVERLEGRELARRRPPPSWPPAKWPPAASSGGAAPAAGAPVTRERLRIAAGSGRHVERTVTIRRSSPPVVVVRREGPLDRPAPFERLATEIYGRFLEDRYAPEEILWFEERTDSPSRIASVRMRADRARRAYVEPRTHHLFGTVPLELDGWYCASSLFT